MFLVEYIFIRRKRRVWVASSVVLLLASIASGCLHLQPTVRQYNCDNTHKKVVKAECENKTLAADPANMAASRI